MKKIMEFYEKKHSFNGLIRGGILLIRRGGPLSLKNLKQIKKMKIRNYLKMKLSLVLIPLKQLSGLPFNLITFYFILTFSFNFLFHYDVFFLTFFYSYFFFYLFIAFLLLILLSSFYYFFILTFSFNFYLILTF